MYVTKSGRIGVAGVGNADDSSLFGVMTCANKAADFFPTATATIDILTEEVNLPQMDYSEGSKREIYIHNEG